MASTVSHEREAAVRAGPSTVALAVYEPDMATNVAAAIRLCACLAVPLHVIEPAGFVFDQRRLRRVALDYADHCALQRHVSFRAFEDWRRSERRRLVLLTTAGRATHLDAAFQPGDVLVCGRESGGVPALVEEVADLRLRVPIRPETRSLNLVQAATLALGEALRQLGAFPPQGGRSPAAGPSL